MAESSHKPVTFDRALQREKARQKRHRQGGKQQELSHRLDQQVDIPLVTPKRKKMPAKETPPKKGVSYAVLFGRDPIYVYDDDQAVPSPDECPFHQLPLPHHISKQGWAYVKCPVQPCAVFLDEKAAPTLLDQLRQQKHPQLMAGRGTADDPRPPPMCFCNDPLALRVSRTAQNPGRLFLGCKSQKCRFFQWTDEPWSQALRDRWAQVLQHLGP